MAIQFNNIPDSIRTPGVYVEIDNSRALKGLYANPHKALIIGAMLTGTKSETTLVPITKASLAEGYFGAGAEITRMIESFKDNNPNTELYAIAMGCGTAENYWSINPSGAFAVASECNGPGTYYLMINGVNVSTTLTSGWSKTDVCSAIKDEVSAITSLPVTASVAGAGAAKTSHLILSAKNSGVNGNYIVVRDNYYDWISYPSAFSTTAVSITNNSTGAGSFTLSGAWAIIDNEQFHYIIQPSVEATDLTSIEDELEDRWGPLEDLPGIGIAAMGGTQSTQSVCTTKGNSRNSPYNVITGMYNSPTDPAEIAAALGAVAAKYLNNDPARPLHYLRLKGVLPPKVDDRFTRTERDILLYDGIATLVTDSTGGKVLIERLITTYQKNAAGVVDYSYLDANTLATLSEIRYQFKTRMVNNYIVPRYKLADDGTTVYPGSYIVTPTIVKASIIALFAELENKGLIENLDDFKENLVVERDESDVNRCNVLLPGDLVNQFRILAAKLQFIL